MGTGVQARIKATRVGTGLCALAIAHLSACKPSRQLIAVGVLLGLVLYEAPLANVDFCPLLRPAVERRARIRLLLLLLRNADVYLC